MHKDLFAIYAVIVSWLLTAGSWYGRNIGFINSTLQTIALLLAIAASVAAIRFHTRRR